MPKPPKKPKKPKLRAVKEEVEPVSSYPFKPGDAGYNMLLDPKYRPGTPEYEWAHRDRPKPDYDDNDEEGTDEDESDDDTPPPEIIHVVACNRDGTMLAELPWYLRNQRSQFRRNLMGGGVIVGRKTFESMKPIVGSMNCVLGNVQDIWNNPHIFSFGNFADAYHMIWDFGLPKAFVLGGPSVFCITKQWLRRIYYVKVNTLGSVHLGEYNIPPSFVLINTETHTNSKDHPDYTVQLWRKGPILV